MARWSVLVDAMALSPSGLVSGAWSCCTTLASVARARYRDSLPKRFGRGKATAMQSCYLSSGFHGGHAGSPPYRSSDTSDTKWLHEPAFQICVMHPRHRAPMTHLGGCGEIGMPSGRLPRKEGRAARKRRRKKARTPLALAVTANSTHCALPSELPLASLAIISLARRVETSALVSVQIFGRKVFLTRV